MRKEERKKRKKSSDTPNKRNLIAHGGLERNVTFVRYTGGKTLLQV